MFVLRRSAATRVTGYGSSFTVHDGRVTLVVVDDVDDLVSTWSIVPGTGSASWPGDPSPPARRVREHLTLVARRRGLTRPDARRATDDLLGRLGLVDRGRRLLGGLGPADRRRIDTVIALVGSPADVVALDPFDPASVVDSSRTARVLRQAADAGAAVLVVSPARHVVGPGDVLADDIVVVGSRTVRWSGTRKSLTERHGSDWWHVRVPRDAGWLRDVPGLEVADVEGDTALVRVSGAAGLHHVDALARTSDWSATAARLTVAQLVEVAAASAQGAGGNLGSSGVPSPPLPSRRLR